MCLLAKDGDDNKVGVVVSCRSKPKKQRLQVGWKVGVGQGRRCLQGQGKVVVTEVPRRLRCANEVINARDLMVGRTASLPIHLRKGEVQHERGEVPLSSPYDLRGTSRTPRTRPRHSTASSSAHSLHNS